MIPRPHGLILDLDGTLIDSVGARIEAWMRTFKEEGIEADQRLVTSLIGSDGRQLAITVGRAAGTEVDEDRSERIDARSGSLYSKLNTAPRQLPGVTTLLDVLDALSIPWAIATSSRREQVAPSVAALDRAQPVVIVDGTTVTRAKPHPDLLLAAAAKLHLRPADCWCVGDSTWDMRAATAARMPGIGILAGSAVTADELRSAGAAEVFERLDELIPVVANGL